MRKMKRSLSSIAARIRASKDSPGGSDERSRNTLCPSPLSDSSMRAAASLCSDEYERKMVLIIVPGLERRDSLHLDQESLLDQAVHDEQGVGRIGLVREHLREFAQAVLHEFRDVLRV